MNSFRKLGKTMTYTAPAGGVVGGQGYLIGALFVVATATAAAGVTFEGVTEGVFNLPKAAAEGAWVEGMPIYWDVANNRCSIDHTVGVPIGSASVAALTGDVLADVRLHGLSLVGRLMCIRKRVAIATLNGGATNLIPAMPGLKTRVVDAEAIAIGGAVTTVTTVDLKATQATVGVKLVAFTQASLTQSALVRAGGAGGTLLADGASFVSNDVNTAIQVGITGAAITVATFVDFIVWYQLEAL